MLPVGALTGGVVIGCRPLAELLLSEAAHTPYATPTCRIVEPVILTTPLGDSVRVVETVHPGSWTHFVGATLAIAIGTAAVCRPAGVVSTSRESVGQCD